MADNSRSRRAGNDGKNNTQAYAELVKQRRAGGRVGPMEEWKDEEAVYDVLEESQYAEVVAKRREEGGQHRHRCQMLGLTVSLECPPPELQTS